MGFQSDVGCTSSLGQSIWYISVVRCS